MPSCRRVDTYSGLSRYAIRSFSSLTSYARALPGALSRSTVSMSAVSAAWGR